MVGILGPRQCGKTTLARDYLAARPERRFITSTSRTPTT